MLDYDYPIEIPLSWFLIGYLHQEPYPIEEMVSAIVDNENLLIIKDQYGNVYWPFVGINSIDGGTGLMYPGQGYQIKLIQNACNITEKGLRRILPFIKPGVMEYEIEAELMHEFLNNRSAGFAYAPILGSARNSCVLHYGENNNQCKDGDILLMDFGAEYANYASDMTRTIPVNGRFSDRQKAVYNSVLHVM